VYKRSSAFTEINRLSHSIYLEPRTRLIGCILELVRPKITRHPRVRRAAVSELANARAGNRPRRAIKRNRQRHSSQGPHIDPKPTPRARATGNCIARRRCNCGGTKTPHASGGCAAQFARRRTGHQQLKRKSTGRPARLRPRLYPPARCQLSGVNRKGCEDIQRHFCIPDSTPMTNPVLQVDGPSS
jgi:hypothetical protein